MTVLNLLFTMAHWHGLAKLRLHSDLTLDIMDDVTSAVGRQFRAFKATVCLAYDTSELPQETEVCTRRQTRQVAAKAKRAPVGNVEPGSPVKNVRRKKKFNLQTYKFHALGDYVSTIRRYGTCDSYSTEPVRPLSFLSFPC
jgi:hypothetical protein